MLTKNLAKEVQTKLNACQKWSPLMTGATSKCICGVQPPEKLLNQNLCATFYSFNTFRSGMKRRWRAFLTNLVYFFAWTTQNVGQFWRIYALFSVLFTDLNNVTMYQNGKISGLIVGLSCLYNLKKWRFGKVSPIHNRQHNIVLCQLV